MKIYRHIRPFYFVSGISLAILLVFGILYLEKSRDQVQYINIVEHTYQVLSTINYCEKTLIGAEAAQRGYLLTHEINYKIEFESLLPLIDSSLKKTGELTSDNSRQKTFFIQLNKFVSSKTQILKANLFLQQNDPTYFENLRKGNLSMDNCRTYMAKMRSVEEGLLQQRLETKNKYQQLNLSYFRATFIIACLICIIALGIFFRELGIRLTAQKNLKAKINELSNRKQELEEITYAASHDLQEPMRKVRILATLITKKFSGKISEVDLDIVYRINKTTEQMYELLNDLVLYTNLLNPNEQFEEVNMYNVFRDTYYKVFKNEKVEFILNGNLPVIYGSQKQLETMMVHLFDNCLKFKSLDRELNVTVNCEITNIKNPRPFWNFIPSKKYHHITITDNGIGFDEQYNDKIFGLFQRLHTQSEYPGKGIGLSVAQRVMTNHNGFITCIAQKKTGACFILYFPTEV